MRKDQKSIEEHKLDRSHFSHIGRENEYPGKCCLATDEHCYSFYTPKRLLPGTMMFVRVDGWKLVTGTITSPPKNEAEATKMTTHAKATLNLYDYLQSNNIIRHGG